MCGFYICLWIIGLPCLDVSQSQPFVLPTTFRSTLHIQGLFLPPFSIWILIHVLHTTPALLRWLIHARGSRLANIGEDFHLNLRLGVVSPLYILSAPINDDGMCLGWSWKGWVGFKNRVNVVHVTLVKRTSTQSGIWIGNLAKVTMKAENIVNCGFRAASKNGYLSCCISLLVLPEYNALSIVVVRGTYIGAWQVTVWSQIVTALQLSSTSGSSRELSKSIVTIIF